MNQTSKRVFTKNQVKPTKNTGRQSELNNLSWRDIETAPMDGSHVLLYRPHIQFTGYYGGANSGWHINWT